MYRKTLTTILTLLLLFAFGLSACAPAATPEPQPAPVEPAKTVAPAEAAPKETVQLRMLAEQFDIELKALATSQRNLRKLMAANGLTLMLKLKLFLMSSFSRRLKSLGCCWSDLGYPPGLMVQT